MAKQKPRTPTRTTRKVTHPDTKRGQTSNRPPSHQVGPKGNNQGSKSKGSKK